MKSNIGHLEACAALAAIVKTVECLERASIPPQMHFEIPNSKIDFEGIIVPTVITEWPARERGYRRAAVNTFGAGGTNGHLVLESNPGHAAVWDGHARKMLFKVSAADQGSLVGLSLRYAKYLETRKPNILDLAYTLLSRRSTLRQSRFVTASTLDELITKLKAQPSSMLTKTNGRIEKTVFVFTGQGAQCNYTLDLGFHVYPKTPRLILLSDRAANEQSSIRSIAHI